MSGVDHNITQAIAAWRAGDGNAAAALSVEIYAMLKEMARMRLHGERGQTLDATVLVHEAVVRLIGGSTDFRSRAHFRALAALQMRAVLVDHARRRQADKRNGGVGALSLYLAEQVAVNGDSELIDLDAALHALAAADRRTANALELTYFGGMSADEVAAALDISIATVERDLAFGRAWLRRRLKN